MPAVPRDWVWPFEEWGEPLLFLGQINCVELHKAVPRNPLPESGLLVFFGDHDDVNGCTPTEACQVAWFPDLAELHSARIPLEDMAPLPECGLDFYPAVELPHPLSDIVTLLKLSDAERDAYRDLRGAITNFGMGRDARWETSKLFGWPDLVQEDFEPALSDRLSPPRLLLQIGWYHDGRDWQCWGPGGRVYFTLSEADVGRRRFDRAEIVMQCT
jgi:uncharacterized protein YwqG